MMAHLKDMALFKSQALIGGKWIDATDGRTLPVREPMAFLWEISVTIQSHEFCNEANSFETADFAFFSTLDGSISSLSLRNW